MRQYSALTLTPVPAGARIAQMIQRGLRLLFVLDSESRLVGVIAAADGQRVRGLFCASLVARQLGIELQTFEVARTFAEVEAALVR